MQLQFNIYSPVQQLKNELFAQKQLNVYIKRDDLIHPFISGNKWRKLKYILQKTLAQKQNHLVTFGGAFSNHLLATAAAAAQFGFKATGFVRGEEADNDILFLCKLHGMNLIFTSRAAYKDKPALFNQYFDNDSNACFIDEGGACTEGTIGCSEIITELDHQYDHIFCARGTGTTAAGILNGITQHQHNTKLHAIPVLKGGSFIADEINKYATGNTPYHLHTDYHFGGYAKTQPGLILFIKDFIAHTGIAIDPVYTGKMMYSIYDLARKDYFSPGSNILAIHTGGIWGLTGMKNKFSF